MEQPKMPDNDASEDPKAWEQYWRDFAVWEVWEKNQRNKEYRREYYAGKTRERRVRKMRELMEMFPDEAREYFSSH